MLMLMLILMLMLRSIFKPWLLEMPCPLHKITLIFSYWYVDQTRPYWQMYLSLLTNTFVLYWQMYLSFIDKCICVLLYKMYLVTLHFLGQFLFTRWLPRIQCDNKKLFHLVTWAAQGHHPHVSMRHWWILPSHGVKTVSAILGRGDGNGQEPWAYPVPESISDTQQSFCIQTFV